MLGTLAEIRLFSGTFAPRNWAFCYGGLMPISQNQALFSLIGTYYGGDGRTTFGLPDLRGRNPVGTGNGPGLTPRVLGGLEGSQSTILNTLEMPAHGHTGSFTATSGSAAGVAAGTSSVTVTPIALNDEGDQNSPTNNVPAKFSPASGSAYGEYDSGSPGDYTNMHSLTGTVTEALPVSINPITVGGAVIINNTGSNVPFTLVQPTLALQYIICIEGDFPSRN